MVLKYTEKGSSDSPVTLVLIHAFPFHRQMWASQLDSLSSIARVIAVDLPGYGESAPFPESLPLSEITLTHYVTALEEFLNEAKVKTAVFAGCSMGGYILFEIFRRIPEKVAGLIFCNTRAEADDEVSKQRRSGAIKTIEESNSNETFAKGNPGKLFSAAVLPTRTEILQKVHQWTIETSPKTVIGGLYALRNRPDSVDLLPKINVPTLIVVGAEDPVTGAAIMEPMSKGIPGAKTVVIQGGGHLSPFDSPEQVNHEIAEFLKTL